jgi:hypothetical protein
MSALLTREGTLARTAEPATATGRWRSRDACHRVRAAIQEMNYVSRRVVELQAPWIAGEQRQGR